MRRVKLGGGAVGFELERADRIARLDPDELQARGWTAEAIENYRRYRQKSTARAARAEMMTPSPAEVKE
jgi:hypothetical protein